MGRACAGAATAVCVQPSRLILVLEVDEGTHRILPALRSGAPVVRPAVPRRRLLRLAPRAIASLSLGVSQRHGNCAPLRNG